MIFDFPKIKHTSKDVEAVADPETGVVLYRKSVTVITRSFWIRIIWSPAEKTIILGRWTLHIVRHETSYEELTEGFD